ncbi:MAG: hypothetical protein ACK5LC_04310 [Coprobacillaceae bacterium]
MFSKHPLDFDFYANDIKNGYVDNTEELLLGKSESELSEELKMSCTNVMLQCLTPQERCIFIFGTMFKIKSKLAGEILEITPENYRKKLSRARKKMATFLSCNCGLTNTGYCHCEKRVGYAIQNKRLDPNHLEYNKLNTLDSDLILEYVENMDVFDEQMDVFEKLPKYQSPVIMKEYICSILKSEQMKKIQSYQ